MNNTTLIDNPIMEGFNNRREVHEFIESINSDVLNGINWGPESSVSDELEEAKESDFFAFSNRTLVLKQTGFHNFFSKTQRWIGHVTEINGEVFKAKLEDLTNGGTSEYGEFEMEEVSAEDRPLVQIGATFYWSIGFSHQNTQISRESLIRFQRVLKWDDTYMNNAADRARRLKEKLKWD